MQHPSQPSRGVRTWFLSTDRVATSVGIVLFLMIFERIFWIARGIVFPRVLGPAEYGIYTLGMFPVPLMATLASLGVPSAFGRYISRYAGNGTVRWFLKRTYLITTALSVGIAGVVVARPSLFSRLIFGDPSHSVVIALAAMSIPTVMIIRNLSTTFMGLKLFRAGRFVESSQIVIYAVVGIPLLLIWRTATAGVLSFAVASLASVVIFAPLLSSYIKQIEPAGKPVRELRFHRNLFKFTIWFTITPILASLFLYVDRLSLQRLMSAADQGIYSTTVNLSESISAIGLAITSVIYPHLSTTWEAGNRDKALRDLDLALRVTSIILLIAGLTLIVLGKWIILLLLGSEFVPGAQALPFLVVFYLFTILVWLFGVYPPLIEKTYVAAIGYVAALPCSIALNLTLIPHLGIVGAALATMVSYFLMWCIVAAVCYRFGMPVNKRMLVVCLLTFVLLLPVPIAAACVAAVLYVCVRRTWIFSLAEREIVYAEARRFAGKARSVLRRRPR
jgi:O-antigen/teichoic acid export membrane protein